MRFIYNIINQTRFPPVSHIHLFNCFIFIIKALLHRIFYISNQYKNEEKSLKSRKLGLCINKKMITNNNGCEEKSLSPFDTLLGSNDLSTCA